MTKRRITCLCLVLLLLMPMLLSGCGKKGEKALADFTGHSGNRVGDQTVENGKYTLMWSDSFQRFALHAKDSSNPCKSFRIGCISFSLKRKCIYSLRGTAQVTRPKVEA